MIQQSDLKRFRELLLMTFRKDGNTFETNEIRIENDLISIWDDGRKEWYYLNKNLEWVSDSEDENILKLS